MKEISDFVGISTNSMPGIDIWEAVELTKKYELSCFEIHMGDFEAAVGNPWMIPHAGVWARTFDAGNRKKLKKAMSHIKNLVIHGTPIDLNIAALNPGIRAESKKQYAEAIELGADLGAEWVTYHEGRCSNTVVPPEYAEDRNVEFINEVKTRALELGIKLAYESFNTNFLDRIPDDNFGILLDIGHSVMYGNKFAPEGRGDTGTVTDWIEFLGNRLVEMHIHDVINWSENATLGTAHRSFEYGLCINLEKVVRKLKEKNIIVPMISEIYEPDAETACETLARTKENIIKYWNS
jgi:sugar phosphate isomerase/epimerase